MNWVDALAKIEVSKIRRLIDHLAVWSMMYGAGFIAVNIFFFKQPTDIHGWFEWGINLFFNGIVLPILGFFAKADSIKTANLTQQIYNCVTSETMLIKEITINTHKLAKAFLERPYCINYKSKD